MKWNIPGLPAFSNEEKLRECISTYVQKLREEKNKLQNENNQLREVARSLIHKLLKENDDLKKEIQQFKQCYAEDLERTSFLVDQLQHTIDSISQVPLEGPEADVAACNVLLKAIHDHINLAFP